MVRSEKTRRHIIKKVAPIFNKQGYTGTSMAQLTEAIGMTKGAIYGNFKDKDELAQAAFDYNFSIIYEQVKRVIIIEKNANNQLIAIANWYLDRFPDISKVGGCPLLNGAIDSDFSNPLLKKRVTEAMTIWLTTIVRIAYDGIKSGQISPNVKPEQFATIFASLIEGGIMLSRSTGNSIHLSRNVDHIIHLVNTELRV